MSGTGHQSSARQKANLLSVHFTFSRLDRVKDWPARASAGHYRFDELPGLCSISRSQLRRYFLWRFGKTPQRWMDDLWLAEAVRLLHASDLSVKQIAASLSYEYPGSFARQFRRRYGCSPSAYGTTRGGAAGSPRAAPGI